MKNNVVVIGGGTGNFVVLSALRKISNISISAIVPSTDSGGSTGILRDNFGFIPVGDIRQCIVALSQNDKKREILRSLFSYRFDKGNIGLSGHNLGNLIITALQDLLSDTPKAIDSLEELFDCIGHVIPATLEKSELCAEYQNGEIIKGEHNIDEPPYPHDGRLNIKSLYLEPKVKANYEAIQAINNSDYIIISPGDLYTSLGAILLISNISKAIKRSKSQIIYISNLVNKFGQTYNFTISNYICVIEKYLDKKVDKILFNNSLIPKNVIQKYKLENSSIVNNDLLNDKRILECDLINDTTYSKSKNDNLFRSVLRHDIYKLRNKLIEIFNENN